MGRAVRLEPATGVRLVLADLPADLRVEDLGAPAGERAHAEGPTVKVAALTYTGLAAKDLGCANDDVCALEVLVRMAEQRGAALVVMPEYALAQVDAEPDPAVGTLPSARTSPTITRFSALARELHLYLVIQLPTVSGDNHFSSQIAFDPNGRVVARHRKFELFEGEREVLTSGKDVSTFDTPFGRVGLLICADMYGDPALHTRLTDEFGAEIVAVSSQWTVAGATRWLAAFAHDWEVYVVGANGAVGDGKGGAVIGPDGTVVADSDENSGRWPIVIAEIPSSPPNPLEPGSAGPRKAE